MRRRHEFPGQLRNDKFLTPSTKGLPRLRFRRRRTVSNDFERQFSGTNPLPDSFFIEGALYCRVVDTLGREIRIRRFSDD